MAELPPARGGVRGGGGGGPPHPMVPLHGEGQRRAWRSAGGEARRLLSQQRGGRPEALHDSSSSPLPHHCCRVTAQSTADLPDPWPDRPGGDAVRLHLHLQLLLESRGGVGRWALAAASSPGPWWLLPVSLSLLRLCVLRLLSLLPAALLLSGHRQRGVVPAGRGRSCSSFARGAVALDARWGRRGRSARSGCALDLASEAERALRPMRMRFGVSGAVVFTPKCNATRQRVPVAHV
jgi:hypothetical protein